mgnify:CR=1 FL=1
MSGQEKTIFDRLRDCVVNFDSGGLRQACEDALRSGIQPYEIIARGMAKGTEIIGAKFQAGEIYLSDLIMAGDTFKEGVKILLPHVVGKERPPGARGVLIGTVKGDLHDIGKSIVKMFLQASSFEVTDLGVDVPPQKFIGEVRANKPDVVGMSALMTVSMAQIEAVIKQLKKTGLRRKVRVILGGAPISSNYAKQIGADAGVNDAVEGVEIIKAWMAHF